MVVRGGRRGGGVWWCKLFAVRVANNEKGAKYSHVRIDSPEVYANLIIVCIILGVTLFDLMKTSGYNFICTTMLLGTSGYL